MRQARVAALDALARRDFASETLRRKLLDKGFAPDVVAPVVDRLLAEKLLDDRRYVDNFVSLHAARGHGPVRVRADLRRIGLRGELVEETLDTYPDWIAQVRNARVKKFGTRPPDTYADKLREFRFLHYRGFTGAQIRLALGFDSELELDDDTV
jgi:regulatory protein